MLLSRYIRPATSTTRPRSRKQKKIRDPNLRLKRRLFRLVAPWAFTAFQDRIPAGIRNPPIEETIAWDVTISGRWEDLPPLVAAEVTRLGQEKKDLSLVTSAATSAPNRKPLLASVRIPPNLVAMRILSGIQPSGALHLGNYFGMMKPSIELQDQGEAFYFIADYHSMTSVFDAEQRRKNSLDVALDFLACGLDPKKSVFFRQSDVPEVTELTWLLSTVTPMGLLERATSYKDKIAKGISPYHGLFAYPVLMAADILIYDSNLVPVGQDQKQHLEMTRDIAVKFNEVYGETFVIPEPIIRSEVAKVPGLDGEKMSKSYGNTVEIFGEEKALLKKIKGIKMDSRSPQEPKPDADQNLAVQLLKLVAPAEVAKSYEERLRAGGLGYGDLKQGLFDNYWTYFEAARKRRAELTANLDSVHEVLRAGAAKARAKAREVLNRARKACGLD